MFGRIAMLSMRPRVEAVIDEIVGEEKHWWSRTTSKIVTVTFTYESELFEKKRSYLISSKAKAGEKVMISINPKKTTDFDPYNMKLPMLGAILLAVAGAGLLYFCLFMIEWLD